MFRRKDRKFTGAWVTSVAVAVAIPGTNAVADVWPGQTWESATPAEAGMVDELLEEARDFALTGSGSGIITRSGKAVMTWGDQATLYELKSSTKSVGVTALGLALQDVQVGLDDAAQAYLPGIGLPPSTNAATGWLNQITIRELATHTAGFDKPGGYYALLYQPGTTWSYSDGGANWLADVLTAKYGTDLKELLFARVFNLIGILPTDLTWRSNVYRETMLNGVPRREFGSGIKADVTAMARIGYLYLRNGTWNGQSILPASFVQQLSHPVPGVVGLAVPAYNDFPNASDHYGLLWWNNGDGTLPDVPNDAFWSWGLGDSLIIVIPSLDVVVARAGNGWRSGWNGDYGAIDPFIGRIARSITGTQGQGPKAAYLRFDGKNDKVSVADGASLDMTTAITLEAWIRPESISNSTSQNRVISKGTDYELTVSTGDTGCGFSSAGHVQWQAKIGKENARLCGGVLTPGQWQHIAGTYNGTLAVLYVDEVPVASAARSGKIKTHAVPLVIGNRDDGKRPFMGPVDEVRIWNRALDASELAANRNIELHGTESGLVAYYRFNEGNGQVAGDGTTSANNGVLGATAGPDSQDPQWASN